jgi:hypothetical protein
MKKIKNFTDTRAGRERMNGEMKRLSEVFSCFFSYGTANLRSHEIRVVVIPRTMANIILADERKEFTLVN